jgi:ABC-type polysaccharide/polyol phosphate export permease
MMMRAKEDDRRRSVKSLNAASTMITVVTMGLACVPKFGTMVWFMGGPMILILLILSIVMITKGGVGTGVIGILFALFVLPIWCIAVPLVVGKIDERREAEITRDMEYQQEKRRATQKSL